MPNPNNGLEPQLASRHRSPAQRSGTNRRASPKRRSAIFSALQLAGIGLLALVVGAATFLLVAPPTEALKTQAIAMVQQSTGRALRIDGPVSLTLLGGFGLSLKDVALSAPPDMGGAPTVAMESLDVRVKLLPLFWREVEIDRLVLTKPVFDLRVDGQGRKSWELATADDAREPVRVARSRQSANDVDAAEAAILLAANDTGATQSGRKASPLDELSLGDVKIVDGAIQYADERAGTSYQLDAINVQLALRSIGSPLTARGSVAWSGETIEFDGTLGSVRSVLEERPSHVTAKVTARPVAASYDGNMTLGRAVALEGKLSAKADSVRALARWLGKRLPRAKGFGPMSLDGSVAMAGSTITLNDANLAFDGATATGSLTVETGGTRPFVRANLKMSELDINKYKASGAKGPKGTDQTAAERGGAEASTPIGSDAPKGIGDARSIEDLIQQSGPKQSGPKVKGYVERSGWSEEPMDLEIFGLVDAEAKLAVGKLLFQSIEVGQSQLSVALKNRVMRADFDDVQLYEGKGRGFVTVDATVEPAAIGANLSVDGVAAQGLLRDAVQVDWLAGTGKLSLAVSSTGQNQRELVETLNGKAEFVFNNGAIAGLNVAQTMRGISQGKFSGLKSGPTERTDFSELSASFNIVNGIARNDDLKLASPLLRVSGAGQIMLPTQSLDYLAKPKLVASLAGQGGHHETGGLEIPVKVEGPWAKPSIKPDIDSVLKDPSKAVEAAKEIGKKLKGKNASELIKGVLGGNTNSKSALGQSVNR